ncbi:hypothetical protein [Kitasatospora aureofaciens]|uniref:hypothetical protein n=1 Tax=Kitasatospora aureofaciens TaxID=1894 RepID=UPI000524EEF9|nr:hypothetical protein [Kitasatospora aureofaciens]
MKGHDIARLVGRRTALRYLALGTMASLITACTGNMTEAGGPKKQALKAFAAGEWDYQSNAGHQGVLTITADGRWSTTQWQLSGQWELDGTRLRIQSYDDDDPFVVPDMTQSVEDGFSGRYRLNGGWSSDIGRTARATYKNSQLTLHFPTYDDGGKGNGLTVTCTRRT